MGQPVVTVVRSFRVYDKDLIITSCPQCFYWEVTYCKTRQDEDIARRDSYVPEVINTKDFLCVTLVARRAIKGERQIDPFLVNINKQKEELETHVKEAMESFCPTYIPRKPECPPNTYIREGYTSKNLHAGNTNRRSFLNRLWDLRRLLWKSTKN